MSDKTPHEAGSARAFSPRGGFPAEALASLLMLVLIGAATASFLVYEKGIVHQFGLPLDSGWFDLALGKSLLTGAGQPVPDATESPGYAVVSGLIDLLARHDEKQVILALKLLSLLALSFTGWGILRILRTMSGVGPYALLSAALMVPLSPALVWIGVSGLGVAWGVAFVTLGLADFAEKRSVRGTFFLGAASSLTPGAFLILIATFLTTRSGWLRRAVVAAACTAPVAAWHLLASGGASPFAGGMMGLPDFRAWWVWIRYFLTLTGLTLRGGTHPVLLPLLGAVGAWRAWNEGKLLLLSLLLPPVLLGFLVPEPGMFGRLLFVSLPPLFLFAAVGLEYLTRQAATGFFRGGRFAVLVLAVYLALSGPALWHVRRITAWQVENTTRVGEQAGLWLKENAVAGELIATTAPGAIGYFSGHPVLDLTRREVRNLPLDEVLRSLQAPWVAINIGRTVPKVLRERYTAKASIVFRVQAGVYPPGPMVVFQRTYHQGYAGHLPSAWERSTVSNTLRELSSVSE